GSRTILTRFVRLCGGPEARIAVLATASSIQEIVGLRYQALFASLGAAHVDVLDVQTRQDAWKHEPLVQLDEASGIFITGGDQLKLTALLGGTPVGQRIVERNRQGCVMGGTSAGASVASEHMLAYGASGIPPRKAMMQFAPGLGLISGVVVDQHFGARGRTGRLMTAVAHNPALVGLGLDEDTAVEIDSQGICTVVGRGSVLVVDGHDMRHSDIFRVSDHAPIAIFDLRVHVLSSGYHYDLATRTPSLPTALPAPPPEIEGMDGAGI
ncbi:MAG: cyanophycinase, partial [Chloroflexaceae bacterium]|nr:cyanophycinase [Chloroflexaceae bacterium]